MKREIYILASGPPKPNRNRHLEVFNNKPLITSVIENCTIDDVKINVVISDKNVELKKFLIENHLNVNILETHDYSMLTTYQISFNNNNDILIIAGDLRNLKKENVIKFLNTHFKSAIYRLKFPWGTTDLVSYDKSLIRRSDIGDSLLLIANEHKKEYLSNSNIEKAKYYFKKFYPRRTFNINMASHLWTWLDYVFFFEICSSKDKNNHINNERGVIYIEDLVYLDND